MSWRPATTRSSRSTRRCAPPRTVPSRARRGGPGRARLAQPELAVRRDDAARPGDGDVPARHPHGAGREAGPMTAADRAAQAAQAGQPGREAILVLEDGVTFRGRAFGA